MKAEQKLALAVSGWLMGSDGGVSNPKVAALVSENAQSCAEITCANDIGKAR